MFAAVYLACGIGIGLIISFVLFYGLFYRSLKKGHVENDQRLAQLQSEQETLSSKLYNEGTQRQLEKQTFAREKAQLEADLEQLEESQSELTEGYNALIAQSNETQQGQKKTIHQLQEELAQTLKEKSSLEAQLTRMKANHEQQLKNLQWDNLQLQNDFDRIALEKSVYEKKAEERRDEWEQKRLDLDIQVAQSHNEIKKLEAKLAVLAHGQTDKDEQDGQALTDQIKQLLSEKDNMAQKLNAQIDHTQALEEEIEQLMERLLRVQSGAVQN
jgi:chromosome segregation ATPase